MATVQHIVYGLGGTLSVEPLDRPSNVRVTVYDSTGAVIAENSAANIKAINTTLTTALNARTKTITVANATTMTARARIVVGDQRREFCRVKYVNGNSVLLWHPTREAHVNNASVYSTFCSRTIPATNADQLFFDGRARWELSSNTIIYTGVECTRYPLARMTTEQDVYLVNPQFSALMAAEEEPDTALDAAHDYVLEQIGKTGRARVFPGSQEFSTAVALAFARNHYRGQSTEVAKEMFERYDQELKQAIEAILANLTPDDDQDESVEAGDKRAPCSFRMERGG